MPGKQILINLPSYIGGGVKCPYILEDMFICCNGNVNLCCADDDGEFKLGNVFEQNFLEIFNNATFKRFRKVFESSKPINIHPCNRCTVLQSRLNREMNF